MEQQLQDIGLTQLQAKTYLHLLEYSSGRKPSQVAVALDITRTNAYKVLDQLCALDLANKSETDKTYRYFAENPIALATFVANARNRAQQLEKTVKESLAVLQKQYQKKVRNTEVQTAHGKAAVQQAYTRQMKIGKDIHFIKSRADIPFMGYETMHHLRHVGDYVKQMRYGITPAAAEAPPLGVLAPLLKRYPVSPSSYQSPVEWTVCGDELQIISFTDNGSTIRIKDSAIADSFREVWRLASKSH